MTLRPDIFGGKAFAGERGGGKKKFDNMAIWRNASLKWPQPTATQQEIPQRDTSDNLMPAIDKIYPCSHE